MPCLNALSTAFNDDEDPVETEFRDFPEPEITEDDDDDDDAWAALA